MMARKPPKGTNPFGTVRTRMFSSIMSQESRSPMVRRQKRSWEKKEIRAAKARGASTRELSYMRMWFSYWRKK